MIDVACVRPQMAVVGADGEYLGRVERCEGGRLRLASTDVAARGQAHWIALAEVERCEGERLWLRCTLREAMRRWQTA